MKVPKRKIRKKSPATKAKPISQKLITKIAIRVLKNIHQGETLQKRPPLKDIQPSQPIRAVEMKKMKVLFLSSILDESLWRSEQIIVDQIRLLAQEAKLTKTYHDLPQMVEQLTPDLILVLADKEPFSCEYLARLEAIPVKKAIWLSDSLEKYDKIRTLSSVFQYVFTQNINHISSYLHEGCVQVHYLPFAADRVVFHPKPVDDKYKSDILIIGNAQPPYIEVMQSIQQEKDARIWALGEGWDPCEPIVSLNGDAGLEDYYNGAKMIINFNSIQRQIFEINACGAFQFVKDHPNLHEYMKPDKDIITFGTANELNEKLKYYFNQIEQIRMVSSKALWSSTYDYSFLQIVSRLLYIVFNN